MADGLVTVRVKLTGISPISFGKAVTTERGEESFEAHEQKTWRERMHVDEKGRVFLPPMNLKNCLSDAAKYMQETVPGKGKATFTKHFEAGTMVVTPMPFHDAKGKEILAKDVEPNRVFVPSDGRPGGGKRVWKMFPIIPAGWSVEGEVIVLDPLLQAEDGIKRIVKYLTLAGQFIGLCVFRPRNRGYFGRFTVKELK